MVNSQIFIDYYNQIDDYLEQTENFSPKTTYTDKIYKSKNEIVKKYRYDLISFGRLRNAIVHDPRIGDKAIAEPHDEVVTMIKFIFGQITEPKKVAPEFLREVTCVYENDLLSTVFTKIKNHSYSQFPVLNSRGEVTELLTTDTITRWLASEISDKNTLNIEQIIVTDVLQAVEYPHNYKFIKEETSIYEAFNLFNDFVEKEKRNLDALLISDFKNKKLLGLVTIEDITLEMDDFVQ